MTRSRDVANIDTILTTKGDIYAASAAYTPTRLGVGNNGETLVADSSATTGLRYNPQNALANPVINGGFDIWARGTSFTSVGYTADRWYRNGNTGRTLTRQTTNDTTNLPNIQYCARYGRDSGNTATNVLELWQSFETVNSLPFVGKTVTLSFYARKGANFSEASSLIKVYLLGGTGTDQNWGSYTGTSYPINDQSAVLTTTWQRFAFTGTIGSTVTELTPYFQYTPVGTAGAADYFEITGVQIDLGTYTASTAPTFRRSGGTLAGELAACQRYYFRQGGFASYTLMGQGQAGSSTNANIGVKTPVTMRVSPTSVDYSTLRLSNESSGFTVTNISINSFFNARDLIGISVDVASGLSAAAFYSLQANNSTSGYLGLSAEL